MRDTSLFFKPFTTGNPFLGTKLLGYSIGRGSGSLKGSSTELSLRGSGHPLSYVGTRVFVRGPAVSRTRN